MNWVLDCYWRVLTNDIKEQRAYGQAVYKARLLLSQNSLEHKGAVLNWGATMQVVSLWQQPS